MNATLTIQQIEAESMAQVVANVNGKPVTRGQLNDAFKLVQPKDHWKNPINVVLALTADEREMVREAIVFFTGSVARFETVAFDADRQRPNRFTYRVTAAGYFATIGA